MTMIDQWEFPDDLRYDEEHLWARLDGAVVTIGLSQFGQYLAGEIVYVEVPRVGRQVDQGEPFMSLESGKWVGRVKSPVSGRIAAVNEEIEWESALVNEDPYGEGWLAKIEITDASALGNLITADAAELADLIARDRAKYGK